MGTIPIVKAIANNRRDIVELFIKKGVDLKGRRGFSALKTATIGLKLNYFKLLVEHGADIDFNDYQGNTILHLIASGIIEHNLKALKGILNNRRKGYPDSYYANIQKNVNSIKNNWVNYEKIITFIVQNSKSTYIKNYDGKIPLEFAQENNTSKVIRVLKDLNIDTKMTSTFEANKYTINKKEITKEFLLAIREKAPIDVLHHMIDNGADINALDYSNWTPLFRAIENDQTELALLLIESGTEVNNDFKPYATSPLLASASYKGNIKVMKKLIENGVLVNFQYTTNRSALSNAAFGNQDEAIQLLLDNGANINIKKSSGETPLHIAVSQGYIKVIKVLLANGADVNTKDNSGNTPLHYAVRYSKNNEKIINLLLNNGANINAKNKSKNIPLYNAIFKSGNNIQYNIVQLLIDKGSNVYSKGLLDMVLMDIIEYQKKDDTKLLSIVKKQNSITKQSIQ